MSKILGSWSGMRKYLEQEMPAECLKGRIRYGCTSYPGMDYLCVFEICVDGKQIKRFSMETVNTYFINSGYTSVKKPHGKRDYWQDYWELLDKYPLPLRTEYTDDEFAEALMEYRNTDIQSSFNSENPIVRMFAVLDRRVGKRTLAGAKELIDRSPEWLKFFYNLRIEAEKL